MRQTHVKARDTEDPPLVVVRLRGGVGNQIFQYAVGRCVAERHGRELVLDDVALLVNPLGATSRAYSLHAFDIDVSLTSRWPPPSVSVFARLVEQRPGFHREVLEPLPFRHIYLQGFWQDERYFLDIEETIRVAFWPRPGTWREGPWARAILAARYPVAVHVRRQDYLTNAGDHLGFVGREYYDRGVRWMAERVGDPQFFVFSDDIAWCEETLVFRHPHSFVRHNDTTHDHTLADFKLMSLCKHFIIANSSFSWWTAWLGLAADKIVIAPLRWFRDERIDTRSMTPASWLRL